jgi:elongator complex protein 3
VRCREVGVGGRGQDAGPQAPELELRSIEYEASGGTELFLTMEDASRDLLHGYLRLRLAGRPHREEFAARPAAIVRELKVPGQVVPLGGRSAEAAQHRGTGQVLLAEAERIAFEERGVEALFVLAGAGVKPYYRRLGFEDRGVYLVRSRKA